MQRSTIHFTNNTVIKTNDPNLMRIEVEKSQRAYQIGKSCGLFIVPEILEYDEDKGITIFRRIEGIRPIDSAVSFGREYTNLADVLGKSLAIIHKELTLPSDMIIPLPNEFNLEGSDVFLHGDLSTMNVCISSNWPPIVILDWQMTSVHGGVATYGTKYFDLMWFINNLLYRTTIKHFYSDPVTPVSLKFLTAYFSEVGISYNAEEISFYAKRFFEAKLPLRQRSTWKARLSLSCSRRLTKIFLKELTTKDFISHE
jgi:hypothetical protein